MSVQKLRVYTKFLNNSQKLLFSCDIWWVIDKKKVEVKEGLTPKERTRGAHLPFVGR